MHEKTLKRLGLTEPELDKLIEDCIALGWKWTTVPEEDFAVPSMFIPPDDRINWCAEWFNYKQGYIPHWISREKR